MGRRADRWLCVLCGKRRVPRKGCLCARCAATAPGLPPRRRPEPPRR